MIKLDEIYQSREFKTLDDIFANDSTGLLDDVKPIAKNTSSNNPVLVQQFSDINSFVETHGHPPNTEAADISEKILARYLQAIQNNPAQIKQLITLDKYGLLHNLETTSPDLTSNSTSATISESASTTTLESTPINSLDDIFNNDELGIFDDITPDILVSECQTGTRAQYDQYDDEEIASRFECQDFYKFETTFERIYHAIQMGAFTKTNFSSVKDINIGSVFVLNGILCYVADIYKAEDRKNERNQYRLRLIFANGTESNMLIRSLASAQYKYENSYQLLITDPDWMDDEFARNFGDNKHLSGVIYVAKLINTPENLIHYQHLHKIGFSTLTGEMRTKHSIKDTAFLQQPVDISAEWQIYDANARSVESVLHAFFYDQRVKVSTKSQDDKLHRATEWFNVPLSEIEKAIHLVISGDIKNYYFDAAASRIVSK